MNNPSRDSRCSKSQTLSALNVLVGRRIFVFGLVVGFPATTTSAQDSPQIGIKIDSEFVQQTINSLAAVVRREYLDADTAARVDTSLRQSLSQGRYASVRTLEALAALLTRDLFALTNDKHLAVALVPDKANPEESREAGGQRSNFGVQRVEILSGNVGYLNITAFYRPGEARAVISAAMRMLTNADALVVDLRGNKGGSVETVALVASYFFDTPGLPLFEVVPRSGKGARRFRAESGPLPERNGRRPVFVLTDERTFSGGEALAFILQEQHRAEVVGETTAGAANPGRPYPLNARLEVTVPNGRIQGAISSRNWEGGGVVPDVRASSSEAPRIAHARALRRLIELAPKGSWRDQLEREVDLLDHESSRR